MESGGHVCLMFAWHFKRFTPFIFTATLQRTALGLTQHCMHDCSESEGLALSIEHTLGTNPAAQMLTHSY